MKHIGEFILHKLLHAFQSRKQNIASFGFSSYQNNQIDIYKLKHEVQSSQMSVIKTLRPTL